MATSVVNHRNSTYDVNIMRPGRWGNPFEIGRDGDRYEVIEKHRAWIWAQPHLLADLSELRGKVLGCCCKPKPCHGDTLADLADTPEIDLFRTAACLVIKSEFVDEWLSNPNDRFGRPPIELFDSGDAKLLWGMLWALAAGVPS